MIRWSPRREGCVQKKEKRDRERETERQREREKEKTEKRRRAGRERENRRQRVSEREREKERTCMSANASDDPLESAARRLCPKKKRGAKEWGKGEDNKVKTHVYENIQCIRV